MSFALLIALLLGGYIAVVTLALGLTFFTYTTAPRTMGREGEARLSFLIVYVGIWSLSAAAGGMMVGALSQWHPNIAAFLLACGLFALLLSASLKKIGKTSLNYDVLVAACAFISTVTGSLLVQFLHLHIQLNL